MTVETCKEKDRILEPASFGDMPNEIHLIILRYLFQNDKLTYGLLGKKYVELSISALLENLGVVVGSWETMPYNFRNETTVISSKNFNKLVGTASWKRYSHLTKTFALKQKAPAKWIRTEVSFEPRSEYFPFKWFAPSFPHIKEKLSPVELNIRITDTSSGPIPSEVRKLSITFDGLNPLIDERNQLQCWSKNFGNLKSLSLWNLRTSREVIDRESLNIQGSQLLELETLEIGCILHRIRDMSGLFNPTKLKTLYLENTFNKCFVEQCINLRNLGLFFYYHLKPSDEYTSTSIEIDKTVSKSLQEITLSKKLVEFRTNVRALVEERKHLSECSDLQTIVLDPVSVFNTVSKWKPTCYVEKYKDAIRILQYLLYAKRHPKLEYFSYGMEFIIGKVDGRCVELVIRGANEEKAYRTACEDGYKNGIFRRREVQGLQKTFYEYYLVQLFSAEFPVVFLRSGVDSWNGYGEDYVFQERTKPLFVSSVVS